MYVNGKGSKLITSGLKALSRCVFRGKELLVSFVRECEIIWTTRKKPDFMRVYAA